jgi:hypothetical protein
MAEVRDKYSALATEISSLRVAIDSLQLKGTEVPLQPRAPLPNRPTRPTRQIKRSYAKVARTHQAPRTTKPHSVALAASGHGKNAHVSIERENLSANSGSKVKVTGARRIWNTLPACSAKAIATTISKLVPTKLDQVLRVKRKTKNLADSTKTVWWFVVHGSESDLAILESDWDKVHQQTLWSLQDC